MSWNDIIQDYIPWLNRKTGKQYRLPSEAEWEYAARAGTTTPYSTGSTISQQQANFSSRKTVPVGSYAANPFALYDMRGNVWEWVQDCFHDNYNGAPTDGGAWIDACGYIDAHVNRGGAWNDNALGIHSAARLNNSAGFRNFAIGFRLARTP